MISKQSYTYILTVGEAISVLAVKEKSSLVLVSKQVLRCIFKNFDILASNSSSFHVFNCYSFETTTI